ncbi:MAG: LPPG:FO 2-phospho-L-lactate transferase [Candidatus Azotimanducaceae bacterium]|jgi:LPPG:FO 2-phospho-L-lactate transferase
MTKETYDSNSLPLGETCLAISGGVGGAKLALGLSKLLPPEQLNIVANTGDDFDHLGYYICPDLDTVMYTLAELSNKELGWGQAGETWHFLNALERLGGDTWFRLGDRDLATHAHRTQLLSKDLSLSDVTKIISSSLGIKHPIIPMSDSRVATQVHITTGEKLAFQHYFVRDKCLPEVTGFEFSEIESATGSPQFISSINDSKLNCIIICPSNPFVSVDPVLKIPGILESMQRASAPIIAVSPIVAGIAIKGPAAKMMRELGMPETALAVATHYRDRIDGFVIDESDASMKKEIEALGMSVLVCPTIMRTESDRIDLAKACLHFAQSFPRTTRKN